MSARDTALSASEKLVGTEVGVSNWITVDRLMISPKPPLTSSGFTSIPSVRQQRRPSAVRLRMGS